jgi:PAS domain S-box-containing protein
MLVITPLSGHGPNEPELELDADFRSQKAFNLLEEKFPLGVWTWELESQKMKWSKGFFRLLGYEPGVVEPSYDALESLTHPDDLRPADELERLFTDGGTIERKFRIVQRDGRVRWVLSRGEFFASQNGKPKNAMGVLTDITSLHAAESKAEALQDRLYFLIEASSAVMWIVSKSGLPGDRQAWCKLTGQTTAEVMNSGWLNAVHPDDREATKDAWNLATAAAPYKFEYRIRRANGDYRWHRAQARPLLNEDKSAREWLGVCFDVHDQKVKSESLGLNTITGVQIRAARGILNWSIRDIAEISQISASSIRRLEETAGPSDDSDNILVPLKGIFENAGVEFLFPFAGKPGVRPR